MDAEMDGRKEAQRQGAPVITRPTNHSEITPHRVSISGLAAPHSTIELFDWLLPVGKTQTDGTGHWTLSLHFVPLGEHLYTARATDDGGSTWTTSSPCKVVATTGETSAPEVAES